MINYSNNVNGFKSYTKTNENLQTRAVFHFQSSTPEGWERYIAAYISKGNFVTEIFKFNQVSNNFHLLIYNVIQRH